GHCSRIMKPFHQALITFFERIDVGRVEQIETVAQLNNGTDNGRVLESFLVCPPPRLLGRVFPKVNARAEPVVVVLACMKRLTGHEPVSRLGRRAVKGNDSPVIIRILKNTGRQNQPSNSSLIYRQIVEKSMSDTRTVA